MATITIVQQISDLERRVAALEELVGGAPVDAGTPEDEDDEESVTRKAELVTVIQSWHLSRPNDVLYLRFVRNRKAVWTTDLRTAKRFDSTDEADDFAEKVKPRVGYDTPTSVTIPVPE